jgi:hypothetical protein
MEGSMLRTAAFLCALLAAGHAQADCLITHEAAPADAPKFSDYPAAAWSGKPAAVKATTPQSKQYRTVLREAQKQGPDFAGRFRVAQWGCGAGCTDWAVIDAKTGQVVTPENFRLVETESVNDDPLIYHRDSRLLMVLGAPEEDMKREGAAYLLWTGTAFKVLKTYPTAKVCKEPATTP